MASYNLVTPPTVEVITLAEAKQHLRVDTTEDDDLISALIIAARNRYEGPAGYTGTAFLTQTWDWWVDTFPSNGVIEISFGPIQQIVSIENGGASLDPLSYQADLYGMPARVAAATGTAWPATSGIAAVKLRLKVGYGDTPDKVPELAKRVMLVTIGYWYANRGGYGSDEFPRWIDLLALPLKRRWAV